MARKGYYENEEEMFIPESPETTNIKRRSYWLSDSNGLMAMLLLIGYVLLIMILFKTVGNSGLPVSVQVVYYVVATILYLVTVVQLVVRRFMLKEKQLIDIIKNLDINRKSTVDVFDGLDRLGKGQQEGILYYKRSILGLKRGVVVGFDKGSIINVNEGFYADYRKSLMDFLRGLHDSRLSYELVSLKRTPKMTREMYYKRELVRNIKDDDGRLALHNMNLQAQMVQELDRDKRYYEYYLVTMTDYRMIDRLKDIVDKIIDRTLATNGYIVEPHILMTNELEELVSDYYLIDEINLRTIRQQGKVVDFEDLVDIIAIYDEASVQITTEQLDERVKLVEREENIDDEVRARKKVEEEKKRLQESLRKSISNELWVEFNNKKISIEVYDFALKDLKEKEATNSIPEKMKIRQRIQEWNAAYEKVNSLQNEDEEVSEVVDTPKKRSVRRKDNTVKKSVSEVVLDDNNDPIDKLVASVLSSGKVKESVDGSKTEKKSEVVDKDIINIYEDEDKE